MTGCEAFGLVLGFVLLALLLTMALVCANHALFAHRIGLVERTAAVVATLATVAAGFGVASWIVSGAFAEFCGRI